MADITGKFKEALDFAFELHKKQRRKGTKTPYLGHLLSVAGLVFEMGGDEEEAIAGLLHDAVEDQGGAPTLEVIRDCFGERVAAIVAGCSDTDQMPKPPWRERKEAYLAHLATADVSVLRVSLADKIHNARDVLISYRSVGEAVWDQFKGGKDGTLWYFRELAQAFQIRLDGSLCVWVDELTRVVDNIETLSSQ